MQKPEFVTFTGIDADTDVARLRRLQSLYPVEWGVLFSPNRQGQGRYPDLASVPRLANLGLSFAAHVCGGWASSILDEGRCDEVEALPHAMFGRVQVNTSRREPEAHEAAAFARWIGARAAILQTRDRSFPGDDTVDWLYDVSGGFGREPDSWKVDASTRAFVGYAGGIGPGNVMAVLSAISASHPDGKPFWIDMETGVRTEDRLDLDKCEAVLTAVYGAR